MTTKAKFTLKDVDRGWNDIVKTVRQLKGGGAVCKVGYFGARAAESRDGLTNVELGLIHEFGVPGRIPERSHLRHTFDKFRSRYEEMATKLLPQTITGKLTLKAALDLIGLRHSTDIKNEIAGGHIRQELSEATLARKLAKTAPGSKGSPKALIDTGRLLGSLTYSTVIGKGGK